MSSTAPIWAIESYEDGEVLWWNNTEGWVTDLHEGATLFTDNERYNFTLPLDGTWVEMFQHEVDGVLTSEECPGRNTCQDCKDVMRQIVENTDSTAPPTKEMSSMEPLNDNALTDLVLALRGLGDRQVVLIRTVDEATFLDALRMARTADKHEGTERSRAFSTCE